MADVPVTVTSKPWWSSKILWVNALASVALFAQGYFGFVIPLEVQALILAGVNFLLRIITKDPLVW